MQRLQKQIDSIVTNFESKQTCYFPNKTNLLKAFDTYIEAKHGIKVECLCRKIQMYISVTDNIHVLSEKILVIYLLTAIQTNIEKIGPQSFEKAIREIQKMHFSSQNQRYEINTEKLAHLFLEGIHKQSDQPESIFAFIELDSDCNSLMLHSQSHRQQK